MGLQFSSYQPHPTNANFIEVCASPLNFELILKLTQLSEYIGPTNEDLIVKQ